MEQYNILIVEDDKEIRDGIEIFLKSQNYNVYKAAVWMANLKKRWFFQKIWVFR